MDAIASLPKSLKHIEDTWTTTFPNFIFEYNFLDDRIARMYVDEQRFLSMSKLFSFLAIFIGCLGIYGLVTFFVSQRTKEIGIRKVLGGSALNIIALFSKDFLQLIAIAGMVSVPVGWYFMNRWLQNYTYRTSIDWWVFGLAIGFVLILTLIVRGYKWMRAALANPVKSLRTD